MVVGQRTNDNSSSSSCSLLIVDLNNDDEMLLVVIHKHDIPIDVVEILNMKVRLTKEN